MAYFKSKDAGTRKNILSSKTFLILLGFCLVVTSVFLWKTQESRNLSQLYLQIKSKAIALSGEAEIRYRAIDNTLNRLANQGVPNDGQTTSEWQDDAAFYRDSFEGIKSIAWVDKDFFVRIIVPLQGNDVYLNQKASEVIPNLSDVTLWVPTYNGSELEGFVLATIAIDALISPLISDIRTDYMVQLSNEAKPVFTSENWNHPREEFLVNQTITWQDAVVLNLSLAPTDKYLNSAFADAGKTLVFSLLFSFITIIAVFFAQKYNALSKLNESRYRELLEDAQLVAVIMDVTGRVTFCNNYFLALTGWQREEVLQQDWFARFIASDGEQVKERFTAMLHNGNIATHYENSILTRSGEQRCVMFNNTLLRDTQGNIIGVASLGEDITERKQAEKELAASRNLLQGITDNSTSPIYALDSAGKFLLINRSMEAIFGIPRATLIGKTREAFMPPEIATEHRTNDLQVIAKQTPITFEEENEESDGKHIYLSVKFPLLDLDGNLYGVAGISTDITERKQAEKAIRESEEKLKKAQRYAHLGSWTWNIQANHLDWSDEMFRIFGLDKETFTGSLEAVIGQAIHPEDRAKVERSNLSVINDKQPIPLEYRIILPDQSVRVVWAEAGELLLDEAGNPSVLSGTVQDITERKQAEEALRLQSAALNAAANAILITDRKGTIQWVNPAFYNLTGYTTVEAVGKNLGDLVKSAQHEQAFYRDLWDTIMDGRVWRGEIINRRQDGSFYTEEETITPVLNQQGEISHFIAIKQDITDRKVLEAENRKLTEQFYQVQKMDSIGQLAGGIAHDFNNLLVPIVGYAELGMMATLPDNKIYTHFEQIKGAGERAASLTRQILAFSRQQVLEMKIINLNQVIIEFEGMIRRLIGENIILKTHLTDGVLALKADKGQLEQVLLNLVINARDAMPDSGQLTIETATIMLDESYTARHVEAQPGPHVLLAVSDTGHGMDAATQQRVFEPFFTTKPREKGTGLGLATVFGIVKQHGGNIWVYSEPGRGTTFKIYLPAIESLTTTAKSEEPSGELTAGTETIMVVEDEDSVRELVCSTLQEVGYNVLTTADPTEGLKLASMHQEHIHLLLTDVIMPYMNGRELFQQIATVRPDMKVLYMSGYTNDAIVHHGVLDEEIAFLQKPFTIHSLLQKVRAVLDLGS